MDPLHFYRSSTVYRFLSKFKRSVQRASRRRTPLEPSAYTQVGRPGQACRDAEIPRIASTVERQRRIAEQEILTEMTAMFPFSLVECLSERFATYQVGVKDRERFRRQIIADD